MGLTAAVVDPLSDPVPAAWDDFVAAQRLSPLWGSRLLRTAAWCTQAPASMVLVYGDGAAAPIALFYGRHLGPLNPTRFVRPGRMPAVSMTECRTMPVAMGAGMAFAAGTDQRERAEAVRVFERAIRRRTGAGGLAIAYRELRPDQLPLVPAARRIQLRLAPNLVLHNEWADLDSYLGGLARKWRSQLRKIHHTIRADPTISVDLVDTVPEAEACRLAEVVRARYISRGIPRPPVPARYIEQFAAAPGSRFLTYRETGGRLLAYSAVLAHGDDVTLAWWGSRDETDGGRANLYFDQYLRLVDFLIRSGRRRLLLGKGMEQIKARYGARPEPLWGVLGLR